MPQPVQCTIHLISLNSSAPADLTPVITHLQTNDLCGPLVRAIPYGWVHKPHNLNADTLLSKTWDLFFLTERPDLFLGGYDQQFVDTHLKIPVETPGEQFDALKARAQRGGVNDLADEDQPKANPKTPALPEGWKDGIPSTTIARSRDTPLRVGELYLDQNMANYLSTAESQSIRGSPVSFFNLFKYANGDRSIHDSYMQGFKDRFGPDAGAEVKFMGPVTNRLAVEGSEDVESIEIWNDANLVQYDSVWHYAYMLSTEVYQELNQEKMRGLEDTCILMVSEVGWQGLIRKIPGEIVSLP